MKATLALLLPTLLISCSAPQITAGLDYSPLTADGSVSLASGGGASLDNSLSDVGLDEEADTIAGRADFKWGLPHLTVLTQQSSWDGSGTLSADFGGIAAGTTVNSDLDLGLHRAILTFDIAPTDLLELGLGFGLSYVDLQAAVKSGVLTESIDEQLPVPVLALRAGGRVWRVDLQGLLSGMSGQIDGDDANYVELDLNAKLALFGEYEDFHCALVLGWRSFDLELDYDDGGDRIEADLTFQGPYVGLQVGI